METFQQISEEGRPPESPNKRYFNRKLLSGPSITAWSGNVPRRSYLGEGAVNLTNKNIAEFNNNVFDVVVHDLNRNVHASCAATGKAEKSGLKQTLPKLLCLKKAENRNDPLKTLNVNTLRTEHFPWNEYYEAQSSLPDSDVGSNNCEADDLPSSSRETGLSGKCEKRKSFHQNVEEALNSILWQPYEYQNTSRTTSISASSCTSPASSIDGLDEITKNERRGISSARCSFTDLHPPPTSEVVINPAGSGGLVDQSPVPYTSRDRHGPRADIRLSNVAASSAIEPSSGERSATVCDENCAGMEVNVSQTSVLSVGGGVFSSDLSLSSANVVGLPSHARYASVPVGRPAGGGGGAIFPNHSRNVSEPTSNFMKQSNSSGAVHQQQQQRHSTQLDQSSFHQINHLRSSSVPKSLAMVPRHESSSTTTTTTTVPSAQIVHNNNTNNNFRYNQKINYPAVNSGNVNVNFYRAAPVSVVSSVPTITCLNTLSNVHGNEVSNVQVLPLNSTTNNANFHNVTTQVILHNSQPGCNSIQIAQQTAFDQQVVQVQPNKNLTAATTTTTTTLNQVVVHTTRPASSTFPAPQRTYTNLQEPPRVTRPEARTFTSTEAQTDEVSVLPPVEAASSSGREHRRRERRERRHQRRGAASHPPQVSRQSDRLPDLLNSHHLPPPYSAQPPQMLPPPPLPHATVLQSVVPNNVVPTSGFVFQAPPPPPPPPIVQGPAPVAVPVVPPPSGFRFPFPTNGFRRSRFTEDSPKGCCGLLSWKPGSLRWFIALIALVAVCCVLVGTALGAMRPAGRDHLTVSLLMIGVGIVLVTVSGVAWRLTSHDSSTCRSMLGLGSTESVDACTRRFVPRLPPSYGRPHHPYAAMMYPEFQYRPPPPSYQASMQEYRLRLLLLDRGNTPQIQAGIQNAVSPPPTYRSHAGSLLRAPLSSRRDASQSEYSCPPSYRSQNSTNRQGTLASNSVLHSREQSLSLSESNHGGSVVNVVNILGSTAEDIALDNITLDSLKMEPESDINPVKMLLKGNGTDLEGSKDGNLVTIVQTSDQSPVIVTVSGSSQINSNSSVQITEIPSEMEILAHL